MVFFVILLTILLSSPSCFSCDDQKLKNAQVRRVNHQENKNRKLTKGMINSTKAESIQTVNVDDFGAKADGRTDDSQAITFSKCTNLRVTNLMIKNPQQMHVNFQDCQNVEASNLTLTAPEKSPNTDGIHVSGTRNISIKNSVVKTGDDCISIVNGSRNVQATGIVCGPGHGISIGSLGKNGAEDQVSNVLVNGAAISGTTNGLRIKTWQGGSGYAKNITFENVVMQNVNNPIIIDQNYCDQNEPCQNQKSAVQVENVVYKNIRGTSASEVAMKFDCSATFPCKGVVLQNVNLTGQAGRNAKATCTNLKLDYRVASISPRCPN
ncbi:Polygalacturonase QRT2 [Forsythia ovata]|uniref:Polygalacturonase QRT2 n=1 Tax=Forsythia ovata TaxID=205694 RepID=A0ABD1VH98_9LAMI